MLTNWTVNTGPKRPFDVSWQLGVVDECNHQMENTKDSKDKEQYLQCNMIAF